MKLYIWQPRTSGTAVFVLAENEVKAKELADAKMKIIIAKDPKAYMVQDWIEGKMTLEVVEANEVVTFDLDW